jgi:hypothetical protein
VDALRRHRRAAFVLPPIKGSIVVYDQACESQDFDELSALSATISTELACVVFAVLNYDDDMLWYCLHSGGVLVDQYNSFPGYFDALTDAGPSGGDPEELCRAFGKPEKLQELNELLRHPGYAPASEHHEAIAKALGLPIAASQLSYAELVCEGLGNGEPADSVLALSNVDVAKVVPVETVPMPFDLEEEVRALVNQDKVISAIYLYRTTIHCSLREAHDYVLALKPR